MISVHKGMDVKLDDGRSDAIWLLGPLAVLVWQTRVFLRLDDLHLPRSQRSTQ